MKENDEVEIDAARWSSINLCVKLCRVVNNLRNYLYLCLLKEGHVE